MPMTKYSYSISDYAPICFIMVYSIYMISDTGCFFSSARGDSGSMQAQEKISEQSQEDLIEQLQRQVDELTAANLILQEQQAHREQLMAMVAHDLRSPLAPIINYAQMLARHICEPQENSLVEEPQRNSTIVRHTSVIISQAHRMSRLVNDLLDVSQLY